MALLTDTQKQMILKTIQEQGIGEKILDPYSGYSCKFERGLMARAKRRTGYDDEEAEGMVTIMVENIREVYREYLIEQRDGRKESR